MKDIARARGILPAEWTLRRDVLVRNLVESDATALLELGSDDPYFAWERTLQSEQYFRNLLSFRMSHYERYGFGVQGVWYQDQFVGQFGFQVLDEASDRVEVVAFLGQQFTREQIGSRLLTYGLNRAAIVGLGTIFGVVRSENIAGRGYMAHFGAKRIGSLEHFGQTADLYAIDTNQFLSVDGDP